MKIAGSPGAIFKICIKQILMLLFVSASGIICMNIAMPVSWSHINARCTMPFSGKIPAPGVNYARKRLTP